MRWGEGMGMCKLENAPEMQKCIPQDFCPRLQVHYSHLSFSDSQGKQENNYFFGQSLKKKKRKT